MKHLRDTVVLVLGLGESGLAMARWCAQHGATVRVWDSRDAAPQDRALAEELPQVQRLSGALADDVLNGVQLLLKSPGLAPGDARIAPTLTLAVQTGVPVQGELDLFARALADLKADRAYAPKVIAITGTNGKTTTTSMAAQLIARADKRVAMAGNIGPTMLDTLAAALALEPEPVEVLAPAAVESIEPIEPIEPEEATDGDDHDDGEQLSAEELPLINAEAADAATATALIADAPVQLAPELSVAEPEVLAPDAPPQDEPALDGLAIVAMPVEATLVEPLADAPIPALTAVPSLEHAAPPSEEPAALPVPAVDAEAPSDVSAVPIAQPAPNIDLTADALAPDQAESLTTAASEARLEAAEVGAEAGVQAAIHPDDLAAAVTETLSAPVAAEPAPASVDAAATHPDDSVVETVEPMAAQAAAIDGSRPASAAVSVGPEPVPVAPSLPAELPVASAAAQAAVLAATVLNLIEDDGPIGGGPPPHLIPPPPPGPVFEHLPEVWVLELSSFQLDGVQGFEPSAAAVLNVTQDHLDWHGSLEAYAAAKARIFGKNAVMVINRDDELVERLVPTPSLVKNSGKARFAKPVPRTVVRFGLDAPKRPGDFGVIVENGIAWMVRALEADETIKRSNRKGSVSEPEELIIQRLMPADALLVRGRHNAANALAALALATAIGCPLAPMLHGLREYNGEPHRVEFVAAIDGVEAYDDSKGTNVGATVAALNGLGDDKSPAKLIVILGGDGKGQDFTPLATPVQRHVRVVATIGRDAPAIEQALRYCGVSCQRHDTLEAATRWAFQRAQPGDAVLLSPACASLDMFRNYAHRAEVFVNEVRALAAETGSLDA